MDEFQKNKKKKEKYNKKNNKVYITIVCKDVLNIKLLINMKMPDIHYRNIENYDEMLNSTGIFFVINSIRFDLYI